MEFVEPIRDKKLENMKRYLNEKNLKESREAWQVRYGFISELSASPRNDLSLTNREN